MRAGSVQQGACDAQPLSTSSSLNRVCAVMFACRAGMAPRSPATARRWVAAGMAAAPTPAQLCGFVDLQGRAARMQLFDTTPLTVCVPLSCPVQPSYYGPPPGYSSYQQPPQQVRRPSALHGCVLVMPAGSRGGMHAGGLLQSTPTARVCDYAQQASLLLSVGPVRIITHPSTLAPPCPQVYVQQQQPGNPGADACLTACLAALCCCCLVDCLT